MYLRFYLQTEENVDKCINELRPILPTIKNVRKSRITTSDRVKLQPETDMLKNIQVDLIFESADMDTIARNNKGGFEIYKRYISSIPGTNAVVRDPNHQ